MSEIAAGPAPKVSIILTTYNFANYAREAVFSLLNQQGAPSFELLVFDDASTDGTVETLADIRDSRLIIHHNSKNLGAAATITNAFSVARGSYIARLDGDDRWRPNFLNLTCGALDADPELGFVYGNVAWMDRSGKINRERGVERPELPLRGREVKALLRTNYICAPALIARREAWALALPWQQRFAFGPGDWFASLTMAAAFPSLYIDEVLADYRIHPTGMHVEMMKTKRGEEAIEFILQHFFREYAGQFSASEIRDIRQGHRLGMASCAIAQRRFEDAKRLYRAGLRDGVIGCLSPPVLRQIVALEILGYERYEKLKAFIFGRNSQTMEL